MNSADESQYASEYRSGAAAFRVNVVSREQGSAEAGGDLGFERRDPRIAGDKRRGGVGRLKSLGYALRTILIRGPLL